MSAVDIAAVRAAIAAARGEKATAGCALTSRKVGGTRRRLSERRADACLVRVPVRSQQGDAPVTEMTRYIAAKMAMFTDAE